MRTFHWQFGLFHFVFGKFESLIEIYFHSFSPSEIFAQPMSNMKIVKVYLRGSYYNLKLVVKYFSLRPRFSLTLLSALSYYKTPE